MQGMAQGGMVGAGASGFGAPMSNTYVTNIDARGADPSVEGRLRAMVNEVGAQAINRAVHATARRARRDPAYSRSFGGG